MSNNYKDSVSVQAPTARSPCRTSRRWRVTSQLSLKCLTFLNNSLEDPVTAENVPGAHPRLENASQLLISVCNALARGDDQPISPIQKRSSGLGALYSAPFVAAPPARELLHLPASGRHDRRPQARGAIPTGRPLQRAAAVGLAARVEMPRREVEGLLLTASGLQVGVEVGIDVEGEGIATSVGPHGLPEEAVHQGLSSDGTSESLDSIQHLLYFRLLHRY